MEFEPSSRVLNECSTNYAKLDFVLSKWKDVNIMPPFDKN